MDDEITKLKTKVKDYGSNLKFTKELSEKKATEKIIQVVLVMAMLREQKQKKT